MCSSIAFVPNEICRAAALLVFGSKHISAVLLFPSSILLRAITTGDHDSVKVLVWACFSRRAPKETEHSE